MTIPCIGNNICCNRSITDRTLFPCKMDHQLLKLQNQIVIQQVTIHELMKRTSDQAELIKKLYQHTESADQMISTINKLIDLIPQKYKDLLIQLASAINE